MNRYANLVGTNKIRDEYTKINEGFDQVQAEMDAATGATEEVQDNLDTHAANDTRHWTTADRSKMDGIEAGAQVNTVDSVAGKTGDVEIDWEDVGDRPTATPTAIDDTVTKVAGIESGAEVNQNAFSTVNGMDAENPTDEVTIAGGTGITISTNPITKTVNITATGTSTPGAHATSHLEDGADPIPLATTENGGLMSAEDKQDLDAAKVDIQNLQVQLPIPTSVIPPDSPITGTIWFEDVGDSYDLAGAVVTENASFDGSTNLWFEVEEES